MVPTPGSPKEDVLLKKQGGYNGGPAAESHNASRGPKYFPGPLSSVIVGISGSVDVGLPQDTIGDKYLGSGNQLGGIQFTIMYVHLATIEGN